MVPHEIYRLDSHILDKIWQDYLSKHNASRTPIPYRYVKRRMKLSQDFESWLFTYSGIVMQEHYNRFIKFTDQKSYNWFVLKYS